MEKVDYGKVDPWIKKNREGRYKQFKAKNPGVAISIWTFEKRRRIVLGIPLSPSMERGYRAPKTGATRGKNSCIYSTVLNMPVSDLEGKTGIEIIQTYTEHLNAILKLGLEAVQMTLVGSTGPMIEIRRYTR